MKPQSDVQRLFEEIVQKLTALAAGNTESVRSVRRHYSIRLKQATAGEVIELARLLAARRDSRSRFVAYELLKEHKKAFTRLTTPLIPELGDGLDSWGMVDCFACYISGPCWRDGRLNDDVVRGWMRNPDRWWRRAAVVSTIALSRPGQPEDVPRILEICELAVHDRDPLVVKALSWALREFSKSHPKLAKAFLAQHSERLASLVTREVRCKMTTGLKAPPKRE
jgi:3-methyladenine DNA glycosylase AlkD